MSWADDIVKIVPAVQPDMDEFKSIELYINSESYDEYLLRCACLNVEPLWTRAEFETRGQACFAMGV